ncbi:EAL domain-containing protein [Rhodovastum atsumiense]|uniref:EAL domain-containing protein n=1 Tax=Rhodovastum atsumiense TaxID=504468 RepID=A0A5M6J2M1_9PROT|nr:EAL domain-containing protein [Rhodovastum atsumiense]
MAVRCLALVRSFAGSAPPLADRTVTRTVTILAGLAATAFALAPPISAFFANYSDLHGALRTSARLHAAEVAILAHQNPAFWHFDGARVSAAIPADEDEAEPAQERRRVYDRTGRLVLESVPSEDLAWPVLSRRARIMDGRTWLGEAEVSRSFRTPLLETLLLGAGSALAGTLLFIVLRVIPLRLLNQALARASYLAAHDLLTGLPNRGLFADRLEQALALARREGGKVAVLCLDLDRFKEVNDTLGHAAGDQLLRTVTARLRACLRESDTLARLGGDEFAVIQPRARQPDDAQRLSHRLIAALEDPINLNGQQASVGVSIGIAFGGGESEPGQMLKNADVALYQAKEAGRGGFCFFAPEMNARLMERRAMELDLRSAMANGELFLHYQPQVDVRTGAVIGAEALLRWNRPGYGPIPPTHFIALAEEIGMVGPIGAWVLQEACRVAATWPDPIGVAVNVSPVQFRQPGFHATLEAALRASGLAPSRLELEITEGVLLHNTDATLAGLNRIRALGVRIAMDDFGTGHSSLGYLQKFRFDKLKIDRSFVETLDGDANAAAIVRAVVGLSEALGLTANAEGVETAAQVALLRAEGCTEVQGYLFGRPMPAEAFGQLLRAGGTVPR